MSIILDLIVIGIIVITAIAAAKRGFVRAVIELAGFIAALAIASALSAPLANVTYDQYIEPPIISSVQDAAVSSSEEVVNTVWEGLPKLITVNAENFGLSKQSIGDKINAGTTNSTASAVTAASQNVIKPIVSSLLCMLYSVIIMIVLLFVVKILARWVNKLFSFSVIGTLNSTLGGILGVLKGVVFALVFCAAFSLITVLSKDGFLIFTTDAIGGSYLFKFLASFSPFN